MFQKISFCAMTPIKYLTVILFLLFLFSPAIALGQLYDLDAELQWVSGTNDFDLYGRSPSGMNWSWCNKNPGYAGDAYPACGLTPSPPDAAVPPESIKLDNQTEIGTWYFWYLIHSDCAPGEIITPTVKITARDNNTVVNGQHLSNGQSRSFNLPLTSTGGMRCATDEYSLGATLEIGTGTGECATHPECVPPEELADYICGQESCVKGPFWTPGGNETDTWVCNDVNECEFSATIQPHVGDPCALGSGLAEGAVCGEKIAVVPEAYACRGNEILQKFSQPKCKNEVCEPTISYQSQVEPLICAGLDKDPVTGVTTVYDAKCTVAGMSKQQGYTVCEPAIVNKCPVTMPGECGTCFLLKKWVDADCQNGCVFATDAPKNIRCSVNPATGHECVDRKFLCTQCVSGLDGITCNKNQEVWKPAIDCGAPQQVNATYCAGNVQCTLTATYPGACFYRLPGIVGGCLAPQVSIACGGLCDNNDTPGADGADGAPGGPDTPGGPGGDGGDGGPTTAGGDGGDGGPGHNSGGIGGKGGKGGSGNPPGTDGNDGPYGPPTPVGYHTECQGCVCLYIAGDGADVCQNSDYCVQNNSDCAVNQPPFADALSVNSGLYCASAPGTGQISFSWNYGDAESDTENDTEKMYRLQVSANSLYDAAGLIIDKWVTGPFYSAQNITPPFSVKVYSPLFDTADCKPNCKFINYNTPVYTAHYYWRVMVWENNTGYASDWVNGDSFTYLYAHPAPYPNYYIDPDNPEPDDVVYFADVSTCFDNNGQAYACKCHDPNEDIRSGETCLGLNINLNDCSETNCYTWWYGDPNTPSNYSSGDDNTIGDPPQHIYTSAKTYTSSLKVCDDLGCCIANRAIPVKTKAAQDLPWWREISPF